MKQKLFFRAGLWLLFPGFALAQAPSFSQFFSSPLNINPGLTANINSKWRMVSNFRNQWIGPASPYATGTVSYDTKVMKDKLPETSVLGPGGMVIYPKGRRS